MNGMPFYATNVLFNVLTIIILLKNCRYLTVNRLTFTDNMVSFKEALEIILNHTTKCTYAKLIIKIFYNSKIIYD
jgi:hypothetical protein